MIKTILILAVILLPYLGIAQGKYDYIEGFSAGIRGFKDGFSVVIKNGKRGLIDKNGLEILPCIYDNYFYGFKYGLLKVEKNNKWGYVNTKGEEVIPIVYDVDGCSDFFNNIAVVKINGKYGCINTKGKIIISPIYDHLDYYSDNGLIEYELNGKSGMIDTLGNKVVSNHYERIGSGWDTFIEGFAVVTKNGKKGYINTNGEETIKCVYDDAIDFSEGLAAVQLNGKWGFINSKGEFIIKNKFDGVSASGSFMNDLYFSNGIARVVLDGMPIFIDKFGNRIANCPYFRIEKFREGFAAVCIGNSYNDSKWGFVNKKMELVVPCIYSFFENNALRNMGWSHYFNNGIAIVATDNGKSDPFGTGYLYSFIDTTGKHLMGWTFEWPGPNFQEGLAAIEKNGKWGFINKSGEMVIPFVYEDVVRYFEEGIVGGFSEGLIAVKKNSKWGFINLSGDNVIPFIYDAAFNFSEGLALVYKNNNKYFVNKLGFCELLCR
jgi:hypothetical protein